MSTVPAKRTQNSPVSLFNLGPFRLFDSDLGNLIGRLDADWGTGSDLGKFMPLLDVAETEDSVEVHVDLPGMKPEDIEVEVVGDVLRIKGHREEKSETKEKQYHRVERSSGSFSRSFTLPCEVVSESVEADYSDGVLNVSLPKKQAVKAQKIEVQRRNGKEQK